MSGKLPAVLAVDGGGSKTDVALVAADGSVLALARGPGVPLFIGDQTLAVIAELVGSAAAAAGLAGDGAGARVIARHLVACVANADLPAEERQLTRMLQGQGWAASTTVANDTFAVLRAGLDDEPAAGAGRAWGVAVTCGTGINCVGVAPDGRTARFLAFGEITGDWGGGYAIGTAAQWHAVRAADGRGPQTALRRAVPAHFGLTEPLDVAEALHTGTLSWDALAGLAPVVLAAAADGDEVAGDLVRRLGREIYLLAASAIRRLGMDGDPVPVVLGGGIVASGDKLLIETAAGLIAAEFPAAGVRVLREAPVGGAGLIGLDLAGATAAAKRRLRSELAEFPAPARSGQAIR